MRRIQLNKQQQNIFNTQLAIPQDPLFNNGLSFDIKVSYSEKQITSILKQLVNSAPIIGAKFLNKSVVYSNTVEYQFFEKEIDLVEIEDLINEDMCVPVDLNNGHLCKLLIFRKNNTCLLFFKIHHLIFDGYSVSFLADLLQKIINNEQHIESYSNNNLNKNASPTKDNENYWLSKRNIVNKGSTFESILNKSRQSTKTQKIKVTIPISQVNRIKSFIVKHNISLTQYFISCLLIVNKLYGNSLFKAAIPINNRGYNEISIGCNILLLPFILECQSTSISEIFKTIRSELFLIYRNRYVSMLEISKITKAQITPYNITLSILVDGNWKMNSDFKMYSPSSQQEDLSILIFPNDNNEIEINFNYKESSFDSSIINRLSQHYTNIVNYVTEGFEDIKDIPYRSKEEINLLKKINNTYVDLKYESICKEISSISNLYSQKIAIKFKNTFLTYNDLNIKSDKLANHLLKHNIEGNAIIGVCMERCPNLIISILGILKAGFVYLPIDQTYPDERIKYIVNNSKTPLLIIDDNTKRYNLPTLDISKEDYLIENRISVYKDNKNNAAYLLYTSGSTGNPKGAINTHKGLINRISWMTKELGYDKNTIFIQKTPFSFDVSLWELILPFTIGATLIIPTPNSHKDINYLIAVIIKEKIDTIHFVPSMLNIFLSNKNASKCVSLKSIICSGEILTLSTSKKCFEVLPDINLYNLYGPTETAIDVTFFKVEKENILGINSIPIGKPIDNIGVHIISQDNIELPIGVKGELLITGIGVASGYYGDSELTGEKFIKNPFNSEFPYTQAYKSGDYAKIDEFGNIIFGGRIDNQVKLHGQRVELREIENLIRKISSIHEVHVNISSNLNNLVAFYKSDTNIDIEILKDGLRRILPKYMIPCIFSRVDSFPLSDNGKLDFKKLDNMLLQQSIDEIIIAPKDERESELLSTFKKVLNNENIGVEHDFFEYGGDSLGAMFIISEYEKINLDILYKFRTVRKIIENKNKQQQDSILKKLAHNDRNKLNLICIPYGGGNSYAYNDMIKFIPNDLNLFAVDLPGHHLGNRDKDLCNFKEISIKVAQEIIVNGIDNIYMYGHCTGSAIAVEIGKIIEETSNISIHKIVVGGTYPFLSLKDDIFFPENQDTYSFIKSMGGFKGDIKKDYQEQMIKWFIHDVSEARKYFEEYQNNKVKLKLKTPLTCITSKEDPFTKKADHSIKNWEYVSYQTSYSELDRGDHYFINAYPNEILNIILE